MAKRVAGKRPTAEQIRLWRARNMVSQSELAEALGVHVQTISNWETGRYVIPTFLPLALEALERRRYETQEALRSGRPA
jgi:DNA-binding transcriptional regulator YiaG